MSAPPAPLLLTTTYLGIYFFLQAAELYSQALAALGSASHGASTRSVLLANRAACQLQLKQWAAAADDAAGAAAANPNNPKAYVRRATALRMQGDAAGAAAVRTRRERERE